LICDHLALTAAQVSNVDLLLNHHRSEKADCDRVVQTL
jgi:hypothetical protein